MMVKVYMRFEEGKVFLEVWQGKKNDKTTCCLYEFKQMYVRCDSNNKLQSYKYKYFTLIIAILKKDQ